MRMVSSINKSDFLCIQMLFSVLWQLRNIKDIHQISLCYSYIENYSKRPHHYFVYLSKLGSNDMNM